MVDIHAAAHGGDLTLKQFLLTGAVACGGLTKEQGNVWGGRSSRGTECSTYIPSLLHCSVGDRGLKSEGVQWTL